MPPTPEPPADEPVPPSAGGVVGAMRKDRVRAALFDEPVPERRIGRYRVIGTLGRGGMGTVLEAVDDALERRVALKLLHHDVPARERGRLLREGRALARLSHPNVVQVHEVEEQPRPFIAMELVRGRTLAEWQRDAPSWRACVRVYLQAGRGLAAAHAQRLVHRDFKPSNCIIDDEGRVRVMDFGLARALGSAASHGDEEPSTPTLPDARDVVMTEEGAVIGTLAYMPLEQLQGREVDARSDQFGFCVALYEALYGERPFEGSTPAALERALGLGQVRPPPRDRRVPLALRRALLRGLMPDPAQRWPTMDALLDALERQVRPRWRGRLAAVAVLGGLSLAGLSGWRELAARRACSGVEAQLVGVWDAERSEAVRRALEGSPLPYARAAWEGVEPRLWAYAEGLLAASRDVCEEAQVRREQPESVVALRTACLHERKVALRETVEVLATAEPSTVERAIGLVAQLPGIERCADVAALLAAVPPPDEPGERQAVQALRDQLISAKALRTAARYDDSLALVEQVATEAEGLGYAPLAAEVALGRGWARYGLAQLDGAVAAFEDAYAVAAAAGHDGVASEAASMLSFIVGERQAKHEVGLTWALTARAHAQRPAAEPGAEALVLSNEAPIYTQRGEPEEARKRYERALALQEQAFGPNDVRLAFTLNGLGVVHTTLGRLDEAAAYHHRAHALRLEALGPRHPYVAMSLNNLGVVADLQGRPAESLAYCREALAIKEAILGPEHLDLVSSLNNVGSLLHRARQEDEAEAMLERAIALVERAEGPSSTKLASVLQNLAAVHLARGKLPEAEALLQRAMGLMDQVHGASHPELIPPLANLAEVARSRGDYALALRYADRAIAVAERTLAPDAVLRAEPLLVKGRVELDAGHPEPALAIAEQALELLTRVDRPPHRVVPVMLLHARALAQLEPPRLEPARREAEQALAALEPFADPEALELRRQVQAWLDELKHRDPPR